MAMLKEGKVAGAMTDWDLTAIKKMEKVIPLDGFMIVDMFYGKEEHFPYQSLREALADYMEDYRIDHFEMGYQDGEKMYVYLERVW